MSGFAEVGVYTRTDNFLLSAIFLIIGFLVIYPLYLVVRRYLYLNRIKSNIVSSNYKLSVALTPPEFSYIFSTKVAIPQMLASLMEMNNKGIVLINNSGTQQTVAIGPKIDKVAPFEDMLLTYIGKTKSPISVDKVLDGFTSYKLPNGKFIQGSRKYVFWWLLRENLRSRNIIKRKITGKYTKLVMSFSIVGNIILGVLPLFVVRLVQMANSGQISMSILGSDVIDGVIISLWALPVSLVISFFLMRFTGRMLGRRWLVTAKFKRYLGQLDAFREFVLLTHRGLLNFRSDELKKKALIDTKPYAIALGYIKD